MRIATFFTASFSFVLACSSEGDHPSGSSTGGAAGVSGSGASAGSAGSSVSGGAGGSGGSGGYAGTGSTGGASGGATGATGGAGAGSAGQAGSSAAGSAGTGGSAGSAGSGGSGGSAPLGPVTVYIAGDSTVSTYADTASTTDQAGWGQMLHESFSDLVTIENRAVGGRTARRFIDEGRLGDVLADIKAGDYFLVQFGTNDSNKTATYELGGETIPYYLDPNTDFKEYLMQYVDGARGKQATPVLVTPPPRNSAYCTGGNGTGAYAQAMRDLGAAEAIAVADLNKKSVDHLKAICPAPTPEDVFLLRGDGTVDGTHFQENGARLLAGFVAEGISESGVGLAAYLE
jgi:lysophospholipase L1-like esterase